MVCTGPRPPAPSDDAPASSLAAVSERLNDGTPARAARNEVAALDITAWPTHPAWQVSALPVWLAPCSGGGAGAGSDRLRCCAGRGSPRARAGYVAAELPRPPTAGLRPFFSNPPLHVPANKHVPRHSTRALDGPRGPSDCPGCKVTVDHGSQGLEARRHPRTGAKRNTNLGTRASQAPGANEQMLVNPPRSLVRNA